MATVRGAATPTRSSSAPTARTNGRSTATTADRAVISGTTRFRVGRTTAITATGETVLWFRGADCFTVYSGSAAARGPATANSSDKHYAGSTAVFLGAANATATAARSFVSYSGIYRLWCSFTPSTRKAVTEKSSANSSVRTDPSTATATASTRSGTATSATVLGPLGRGICRSSSSTTSAATADGSPTRMRTENCTAREKARESIETTAQT